MCYTETYEERVFCVRVEHMEKVKGVWLARAYTLDEAKDKVKKFCQVFTWGKEFHYYLQGFEDITLTHDTDMLRLF